MAITVTRSSSEMDKIVSEANLCLAVANVQQVRPDYPLRILRKLVRALTPESLPTPGFKERPVEKLER